MSFKALPTHNRCSRQSLSAPKADLNSETQNHGEIQEKLQALTLLSRKVRHAHLTLLIAGTTEIAAWALTGFALEHFWIWAGATAILHVLAFRYVQLGKKAARLADGLLNDPKLPETLLAKSEAEREVLIRALSQDKVKKEKEIAEMIEAARASIP